MASAGIRTLYLQASVNSAQASGILEAPNLLGAFLTRAHARGMQVVAWYLPTFTDIDGDLQRLRAMRDFRSGEQGFDGVAVDIEWTAGVPDTARQRGVGRPVAAVSRRDRNGDRRDRAAPGFLGGRQPQLLARVPVAGSRAVLRRVAADVVLDRSHHRIRLQRRLRYTAENIAALRSNLGQPNAAVHVIGGIGGSSAAEQYRRFVTAAREARPWGISLYDFRITGSSVWPILARK